MLQPRRSIALHLNDKIPGETAVTAAVVVTAGRVASGSLGLSRSGGLRSALAWPATSSSAFLPVAGGAGQSQLAVTVPGGRAAGLSATLLSGSPPAPLSELVGASQASETARVYPVTTTGPSMIELTTQGGVQVVASLRAAGPLRDGGATGGATAAATSWVVTPTVVAAATPPRAGPGQSRPARKPRSSCTCSLPPRRAPAADITVNVPASSVVGVPSAFLASAPQASVLVTSSGGPIVAMGASTSRGALGLADYALAMGVRVPVTPSLAGSIGGSARPARAAFRRCAGASMPQQPSDRASAGAVSCCGPPGQPKDPWPRQEEDTLPRVTCAPR